MQKYDRSPESEEDRKRHPHPRHPQGPNDMTKEEYIAVVEADQRDGEEEDKDCRFLINEYGTYEIQPTADTKNVFPAIAQGLSKHWPFDKPKDDRSREKNGE